MQCWPKLVVMESLKSVGEKVKHVAVTSSEEEELIEIWVNDKTGAFSIIITKSKEVACYVIGGKGLRPAGQEVNDDGQYGFDSLLKGRTR